MRKKSLFYAAYTITKIVKQNLSSLKKIVLNYSHLEIKIEIVKAKKYLEVS